jgi:hypothetical protein
MPNPMGALTFGDMSMMLRNKPISIFETRTLNILSKATMVVYKAPLFSIKTFIIFDVQPTIVFHLAITLFVSGGTKTWELKIGLVVIRGEMCKTRQLLHDHIGCFTLTLKN